MGKNKTNIFWILLFSLILVGCGQPKSGGEIGLSSDGQKVVDYLLKDWEQQFRSTTIPHAMAILGMKADDDLRYEIITHFRTNPELARNLRYWGPNNYLLTNNERRIAKYLLNTKRDEYRKPGIAEIAEIIGLDEGQIPGRLAFLAKVGLMESADDSENGYALVAEAETWAGPLRHNFHTVTVEGEEKYDVW